MQNVLCLFAVKPLYTNISRQKMENEPGSVCIQPLYTHVCIEKEENSFIRHRRRLDANIMLTAQTKLELNLIN